jgi:large subunit ribosomal protein L29
MKIHEIRETKSEELQKMIDEEERNLVDLRFAHQLKQLTNTAKLKITKKELARMKTVLRERELVEKKSAESGEKKGVEV